MFAAIIPVLLLLLISPLPEYIKNRIKFGNQESESLLAGQILPARPGHCRNVFPPAFEILAEIAAGFGFARSAHLRHVGQLTNAPARTNGP